MYVGTRTCMHTHLRLIIHNKHLCVHWLPPDTSEPAKRACLWEGNLRGGGRGLPFHCTHLSALWEGSLWYITFLRIITNKKQLILIGP